MRPVDDPGRVGDEDLGAVRHPGVGGVAFEYVVRLGAVVVMMRGDARTGRVGAMRYSDLNDESATHAARTPPATSGGSIFG